MVFGEFNKFRFIKKMFLPYFVSLVFSLGCGGNSSEPTNPSGGGNGGNDNSPIVYVEDSGHTNDDGELGLEIEGERFDVCVRNRNGSSLDDISVKGVDFGRGTYGFLAKDVKGDYFPDVVYVDLDDISSIDGTDGFRINHILNDIRGRDYEKEFHDEDEPHPYNFSDNPRLRYLDTVTLDDLCDFYANNDAITRNINLLEFSADLTSRPELTFAVEAARFREAFVENLNNMNDVVNSIANFFGTSFEKEAYYMDVYQNDLGVLTHESSQRDFSTLKGNVWKLNGGGIEDALVEIIEGPTSVSIFTNYGGLYFLKYLNGGDYVVEASFSGYESRERTKHIISPGFQHPQCRELDFVLNPFHEETLDTLVLQPGPEEGKDAFVSNWYDGEYVNHGDEVWLSVSCANNNADICRSYIQFDVSSIPRNSDITSAILSIYGQKSTREGGFVVVAKKVGEAWNEHNINWDNKPYFDSHIYDEVTPPYRDQSNPVNFDLTQLTQEWVDGTYNNYGIILMLKEEVGNKIGFFVSGDQEESNAGHRPKLTITYKN